MRIIPTDIPDVRIIEPDVHRDERGFFLESYRANTYRDAGIAAEFVQDNHSKSGYRTLRGLHLRSQRPEGKLVRCTQGEVFDVAVDARVGSPTFGAWVGVTLSAENFRQLWIPPGFAHGFCVMSETAEFVYKVTGYYDPADELKLRWDDPAIGIQWPIRDPLLSAKDANAETLAALADRLPRFTRAS